MASAGESAARVRSEGQCPFSAAPAPTFPMPRECSQHPPSALAELREREPVSRVTIWNGAEVWLVTRYEHVRALLVDPRVSSDSRRPGYPAQNAGVNLLRTKYPALVAMDPPEHTRQRRMLTGEFTIKRIREMRLMIESIVKELIDKLLGGKALRADFVKDLAFPAPALVICGLLGVPYEDHEFFQSRATLIASSNTSAEQALKSTRELCDEYIGSLIRKRNAEPKEDLLSRMVVEYMRTGHLTHEELVSIARMLLVAGHETTANTTSLGMLALLQQPDQLKTLRTDPSLMDGAVEEILRYCDATHLGRRRVASADIEIGGKTIRAGEGIILLNAAANRDPSVFSDPDRFDIRRNRSDHIAFGYGIHACLGQGLARMEMQVLLGSVIERMPAIRLAVPVEELRFKHDMHIYGIESLPVAW